MAIMHPFEFLDPKHSWVIDRATLALSHFKETGSRLLIAVLVHHDNSRKSKPLVVIFPGDLAQEVSQTWIVRLHSNCRYFGHEI